MPDETVGELAKALRFNPSHLSRVLRLTLLAPEIVEQILDGRHPPTLTLEALLRPLSAIWAEQKRLAIAATPQVCIAAVAAGPAAQPQPASPATLVRELRPAME